MEGDIDYQFTLTLKTELDGEKAVSYTHLTVLQVLCGLAVIAVVMLQSGKSAGLSGAIAGGADTFLSKNKAKSVDAKLAKMTKWVAILWILLTLSLSIVHLSLIHI